jgi:hypothetical protein
MAIGTIEHVPIAAELFHSPHRHPTDNPLTSSFMDGDNKRSE